jgi:hypothetical protein
MNRLIIDMEAARRMITVAVWFFMFVAHFAHVVAQEPPTPEQRMEYWNRMAQSTNGRFIITGEVLDDNGQQLVNISVAVEKFVATGIASMQTNSETRVVNGSFSFNEDGCAGIKYVFKLDGYYEHTVQIPMPLMPEAPGLVMEGRAVPPRKLTVENLKVILRKKGQLAQLLDYGEVLEYSADGSGVVMDLDRPHYHRRSLVRTSNLSDPSQLPTHSVYLIPDLDADGKISVESKPREDNPNITDVLPKRVRLIMSNTNDGFTEFVRDPNQPASFQMKEAPLAGYNREIILQSSDYVERGTKGGKLFFFKANNKYGKGGTGWIEVSSDRTRLKHGLALSVQPDGTRNLETEATSADTFTLITNAIVVAEETTPPVITIFGNNPASVECGAVYTDAGAAAADDKDGDLTGSITTTSTVNTDTVGTYTVTYKVSDAAGNEAAATRTVKVLYNFTGFMAPIGGADTTGGTVQAPVKTFKAGSKIPVKFTIGCGIGLIHEGVHTLQVVKWNDETTAAEPIDASPADAATTGNQFRWAEDHWQYILDTKSMNMGVGVWELRATLSDGSKHSVFIGLK